MNFVGDIKLYFQSQLISYSPRFGNENFVSKVEWSVFSIENENVKMVSPTEDWYLTAKISKTIPLMFENSEDDLILFKVINSGGLNVSFGKVSNSEYNIVLQSREDSPRVTNVTFEYTDYNHNSSEYLSRITIKVFVFGSVPPKFTTEITPMTVNK